MAKGNIDDKWTDNVAAAAGQSSLPIVIPGWINEVTATAVPGGGGTATVQHTSNSPEEVLADPNACTWVNWDPGSVNVATSRSLGGPVTALRIAAVTQPATLQIVGQRARR